MIALLALAVSLAAVAGLTVLVLVVAAVRRENHATRLSVEAPGPLTALARRILGLHVRRTPIDVPDLRPGKPTRRN
jgi:hypothetical protein